jgi:hypothetical protein
MKMMKSPFWLTVWTVAFLSLLAHSKASFASDECRFDVVEKQDISALWSACNKKAEEGDAMARFILDRIERGEKLAPPCDAIPGKQIHDPFYPELGGVICFVVQSASKPNDENQGELALYYISRHGKSIKARNGNPRIVEYFGLNYNNSTGKIVDVFQFPYYEPIYVLYSQKITDSYANMNTSGEIFSVFVFRQSYDDFNLDAPLTSWFGSGYSWQTEGGRTVYKYPYQTRQSIQTADSSPYRSASHSLAVPVITQQDSYCYEEPSLKRKTETILKAGSSLMVVQYSGGWCRVMKNCLKEHCKDKPEENWILCDGLKIDKESEEMDKLLRMLNFSS